MQKSGSVFHKLRINSPARVPIINLNNHYLYPMEKRRLGRSALLLAPLAFGGNVFGWTADEKESFKLLDGFVSAGFNFIDTADVYSRWASGVGGESETIIGSWLK